MTIFNRQLSSLSVVSLSAGGSQSIVYLLEDTTFYMRLRKQDGSQQDVWSFAMCLQAWLRVI